MTMSGKEQCAQTTDAQVLGRIAVAMRRKKKAAARSKAINPSNKVG